MMSMFEVYKLKEDAVYPKLDFRDKCMRILQEAEENDEEWLAANEKAPTHTVLNNILNRRTVLKNPLWKKALMKGLGYKSINELMGDETN